MPALWWSCGRSRPLKYRETDDLQSETVELPRLSSDHVTVNFECGVMSCLRIWVQCLFDSCLFCCLRFVFYFCLSPVTQVHFIPVDLGSPIVQCSVADPFVVIMTAEGVVTMFVLKSDTYMGKSHRLALQKPQLHTVRLHAGLSLTLYS